MASCLKFLLALATLTLAAAASTDSDQESTFSEVKETETIVSNKLINKVDYMPPLMVIGKSDGSIIRCPHATPTSCEVYHTGYSAVTATLVHGEFLFAGLESGAMLRCSWQRRHSCSLFNQADSKVVGLTVVAGHIYAGLHNGTILRCQLDTPNSCQRFARVDRDITSLAAFGSYLYAGSDNGQVDYCSLNPVQQASCSKFCRDGGSEVKGLALIGGKMYGVRGGGAMQYCDMDSKQSRDYGLPGDGYYDMALFNKKLYVVIKQKGIHVHDPVTKTTDLFAAHTDAKSISITYGTYAVQNKYRLESQKCVWKGIFACPPTVVYYRIQDRAPMEVSVDGGKLLDAEGVLIDTSDAHETHSQKAAMFVMGPDGQLLLSKFHKTGFLHTSSLFAGNPVSGAGLMVVERGIIRNITACSVHYRPDPELNSQVKDSLYRKGYTDSFDSYSCNYSYTGNCGIDDTNVNNMQ